MRRYYNFVFDSARWEGFPFRDRDIVISTPPKSGTTWMQMMCALLVFQETEFDRPLAETSPWLDMLLTDRHAVVAELEAQTHRRFIKTHTPLDGVPVDDRVTYVCVARDPRDVCFSWDNHMANLDLVTAIELRRQAVGLDDPAAQNLEIPAPPPGDPSERLLQWVEDESEVETSMMNLRQVVHHAVTFWDARNRPNVILFHYADLTRDLEGEMRRLARHLGIEVRSDLWPTLVEAATFESMKARAGELAPNTHQRLWHDTGRFFDRARSGAWQDLTPEVLARYDEVMSKLADEELAGWLHGGWGAIAGR
jgi:hypothetical protein